MEDDDESVEEGSPEHNQAYADNIHVSEYLRIDLAPGEGRYKLRARVDQCLLFYESPVSGHVPYILSATDGTWRGAEDGHALEGLLVRDLLRQCKGLPNL